jgi:hypothetical protein
MDKIIATTSSDNAFILTPIEISFLQKNQIETVIYKTNKDFYIRYLHDAYENVNDNKNCYLEHLFCERLSTDLKIRSFKTLPQISGKSGTLGTPKDISFRGKLIERFYFFMGVHHIDKTILEKIITHLLFSFLKLRRNFK